jgi:hypothetical protein
MNKKIKEIIEALEFMGKMGDVSKIAVDNLKTGLEELDEQLTLTNVSQQRELLIDFCTKLELKAKQYSYLIPDEDFIDEYLKDN